MPENMGYSDPLFVASARQVDELVVSPSQQCTASRLFAWGARSVSSWLRKVQFDQSSRDDVSSAPRLPPLTTESVPYSWTSASASELPPVRGSVLLLGAIFWIRIASMNVAPVSHWNVRGMVPVHSAIALAHEMNDGGGLGGGGGGGGAMGGAPVHTVATTSPSRSVALETLSTWIR